MTVALAALQSELESVSADRRAYARLAAAVKARTSLLGFMRYVRPDPQDVDDADRSQYEITPLARLLAEILEKVERGELKRVCVSVGPQMGKSDLISRGFPAWYEGKNPSKHFMLGSYNQDFAEEFGGEVRDISTKAVFRQVFPRFAFRQGSAAKNFMVTMDGGKMSFVGRGGSGTGKPSDLWVCDDALKDDKEAQSPAIRKELWNWFTKVVFTRCHSESAVVVVNTRWSEDDLIGRLCDKTHPDHNPKISRDWTYINLPAVVKSPELAAALGLTLQVPTDPDVIEQFGSVPMASIWEKKKSLSFLAEARRFDPKGFEALYMGNPAPEDGEYFKKEWLIGYKPEELPKNLMKYCGSDHAIDENSDSDKSCFITAGVDEKGIIWVMPNIYWERESDTNEIVDVMLEMMRSEKPLIWWAERENISKAILPFLRKRMIETGVMSTLIDDSAVPSKSKKARAKSIQGMMALQRVRFPTFMHWWPEAQNQLLKFDAGAHDDFVDALAWIGIGLMREVPASREIQKDDKVVAIGSMAWIKGQTKWQERSEKRLKALRGM